MCDKVFQSLEKTQAEVFACSSASWFTSDKEKVAWKKNLTDIEETFKMAFTETFLNKLNSPKNQKSQCGDSISQCQDFSNFLEVKFNQQKAQNLLETKQALKTELEKVKKQIEESKKLISEKEKLIKSLNNRINF